MSDEPGDYDDAAPKPRAVPPKMNRAARRKLERDMRKDPELRAKLESLRKKNGSSRPTGSSRP